MTSRDLLPRWSCWRVASSLRTLWIVLHLVMCKGDSTSRRVNATLPSEDLAVYEGFSNNPWGSSRKVHTEMSPTSSRHRSKRGVVDLYSMVMCATGCDPLAYKGYGCYCGFLGSGYTVDGIDRCCKMHDWCYNSAECPMFLEYFVPYIWKCHRRRPLCALDQEGLCAYRLCECDRHLAECLRRYPCPTTKAVCTSSPWRLLQNVFML